MQVIHPGLRLPVLLPAWAAYTPASSLDAFLRRPAVPSSARGRPLQGSVGEDQRPERGQRLSGETEIEIKPVDSNRGSLSDGKYFMPSSHLHSWMPDHRKTSLAGQDISCALPLRSCHGLYCHSTVIDHNHRAWCPLQRRLCSSHILLHERLGRVLGWSCSTPQPPVWLQAGAAPELGGEVPSRKAPLVIITGCHAAGNSATAELL